MSSKFAATSARGKTPAICKKAFPKQIFNVPTEPFPHLNDQYLSISVFWTRYDQAHPWAYGSAQRIKQTQSFIWRTSESTDPLFQFTLILNWNIPSELFSIRTTCIHDNHGLHVASTPFMRYTRGQPFFIPRMDIPTENPALYRCSVGLSI